MRAILPSVLISLVAGILLSSSPARAQAFLGGTPTAFTPQIGVVSTGTVNDVQAVVSADQKYVTLNMRPQSSTLLALRSFTFQQGNAALGYVGMPETAAGSGSSTTSTRAVAQTPWASARPSISILQRQGMIQITKPAASSPNPNTSK